MKTFALIVALIVGASAPAVAQTCTPAPPPQFYKVVQYSPVTIEWAAARGIDTSFGVVWYVPAMERWLNEMFAEGWAFDFINSSGNYVFHAVGRPAN